MTPIEARAAQYLNDDGRCAWGRVDTRTLVFDMLATIRELETKANLTPTEYVRQWWKGRP